MKLWVLTHLSSSTSTQMVLDAATRLGHDVQRINPRATHFHVSRQQDKSSVLVGGKVVEMPDAVITRMGSSAPLGSLHLLRHIESAGVTCCNASHALEKSRDKVRSFQELVLAGLSVPKTVVLGAESQLEEVIDTLSGPPWILKLPVSTQGKGVIFVESMLSLRSIVDAVTSLQGSLILQEFVKESGGSDVRVIVLGGRAVAAMRRTAAEGEFRSNLHQGASPEFVELTDELVDISKRAALALGLDIAGVDILESSSGYQIIEVNGSPGLEGIQSVAPVNLAEEIVNLVVGD